jgi:hypothetical protein
MAQRLKIGDTVICRCPEHTCCRQCIAEIVEVKQIFGRIVRYIIEPTWTTNESHSRRKCYIDSNEIENVDLISTSAEA